MALPGSSARSLSASPSSLRSSNLTLTSPMSCLSVSGPTLTTRLSLKYGRTTSRPSALRRHLHAYRLLLSWRVKSLTPHEMRRMRV